MGDVLNNRNDFNKEDLEKSMRLWESAAISLVDIRHSLISPDKPLSSYRLPTSTFIYTSGSKAEVCLDDNAYQIDRFGVFHGGKGTELSIKPIDDWLEYYMVLYKAGEPPFHRREFLKRLEKTNPFSQQYAFQPSNPLFISELLRKMFEVWKMPTPLERFYEKSAFYQLVYEVYKALETGTIDVLQPDLIAMAKRYIDGNFKENISIQTIASTLGISDSHLRRNFKNKFGESPQGYLTKLRLATSQKLLANTNYPIHMVASASGFQDEFYFSKLFNKNIGMSPSDYKAKYPSHMSDIPMENIIPFPYNEQSRVTLGKLNSKGDKLMFKHIRNKTVIAAALALMLMLSACGNSPSNNSGDTSSPSSITTGVPEEGTKIIKTEKGEVEVPLNPKRVIVHYLVGDAVSLGVTPIGVSEVHIGSAFEKSVSGVKDLGSWDFDKEEVMSLDPDLIISVNEKHYDELSKIAPTVIVPYGTMSTEERIVFMGEILSKQKEAKEALETYTKIVENAKNTLAEAGFKDKTITILQAHDKGNSVSGNKHALGFLAYQELGLIAPKEVQVNIIDKDEYWGMPSMEVLKDFCGDYIIHLGEVTKETASNPVWQSIPAVKNGKLFSCPTALTYYTDIMSSGALIDRVTQELINMSKQ